jgi:hypothetical protein
MSRKSLWLVGVLFLGACTGGTSQPGRAAPEGKKPAEEMDIQGEYAYEAWNAAENKTYKGAVRVNKLGDYYQLRYDGGQAAGVAIRKGNTLSVSHVYSDKPDWWGLAVFAIESGDGGPRLVGEYTTHPGNGKLGKDRWTFVKPLK